MKTICILNFIALILVLACNFELSDLPYFKGVIQNIWQNLIEICQRNAGFRTKKIMNAVFIKD